MHDRLSDGSPGSYELSDWSSGVDEYAGTRGPGFFNISMIRGVIFRQRWILLSTIALALLGGLIVTLLTKPLYEAQATTRVEPQGNYIVEGQDLAPSVPSNQVYDYLQTLGEVIESRKLAATVVESLNLDKREDFMGDFAVEQGGDDAADVKLARQRRELATTMVRGGVSAVVPLNGRIITIQYRNENPVLAAQIANSYAENFVVEDTRRLVEANAYAMQYLQDQITQIREKLQDSELAANAYARQSRIIGESALGTSATDSEGNVAPTVTASNLAAVNSSYTEMRAKRIELEQKWNAVSGIPAEQLPEVQSSSVYQGLQAEKARVATDLADLKQRYDDKYPRIMELDARLATLNRQIQSTSSNIKAGIRNEYLVAVRQEQALARERKNVSDDTLDEQDRRIRYGLLSREADALRQQLAALLDRYNQISSAANVKTGSITLLDSATVPGAPVSPNLARNLLIALILGVGAAVTVAVLREFLDDRLRTLEDVEAKFGLPLLGHTPYVSDIDLRDENSDPFSALAESYASIKTSIDYALPGSAKVLQFTSSQPAEGKSTTAVEIAKQWARVGKRTLLIDADLRRPSIAKQFDSQRPEAGLAEILLGHSDLHAALLPNTQANLDVLACGKTPPNPTEILSSPKIGEFIARCRTEYDYLIFDTSPVMGIADTALLSRHVDATVFILEANRIELGQARAALRRLRASGANVLGIVLTKFRALQAGQSYGYEYKYYTYSDERS